MVQFFMSRLCKNNRNPHSPQVRSAAGRLTGIIGIVCNFLLFAGKLTAGLLSGSVAVAGDAMNNLSDAASSLITLAGFRLAELPPDENHPYGHARFEYLSGLAVSAMILLIGAELLKTSVARIFVPEAVTFSPLVAGMLGLSILVKLWLSLFSRKMGKAIDSSALMAMAADSRNDMISTGAVLLAGAVGAVTDWHVDGVMGLGVSLFILYSGISMAKETISPLLGENASPELIRQITTLVQNAPLVLGYHDLMVHDYGPGQRLASIHVEMDHREDSMVCHEIIDDLERQCLQNFRVHLVIHFDPVVVGDPELDRLRGRVTEILREIDPRLSIHDFRMVPGEERTNLIFDMIVPDDLAGRKKEIRNQLNQTLSENGKMYYTVITYDSAAFNAAPEEPGQS